MSLSAGRQHCSDMDDLIEERERAYARLMGREYEFVYHETEAATPHVDVYVFGPTDDEDYVTLITGGMSDLPMAVPDRFRSEPRRAELVMFVDEPHEELANVMRQLAHYPHDNKTWFGFGHTIPWDKPLVPGSQLDTIFLANPNLGDGVVDGLVIDGETVRLYQVGGITSLECEFKLRNGANALIDRFIEREASLVVEPERDSYVDENEIGELFPFAGYPTLGVYSTRDVMNGESPILLVVHDREGDWQFLSGGPFESDNGVLIHLSHIVEDHPEIHELRDLPRGWAAERDSVEQPWRRYAWHEDDESAS